MTEAVGPSHWKGLQGFLKGPWLRNGGPPPTTYALFYPQQFAVQITFSSFSTMFVDSFPMDVTPKLAQALENQQST